MSMSMDSSQNSCDDWSIPCLGPNEELEPPPDELDKMYQRLEAGEMLEFTWKCPGRRLPTAHGESDAESNDNASNNA